MAGPTVSGPHRNDSVFGKLLCAFGLYSRNIKCWRWNKLALAINYDTQLVSVLFEVRDSGGFPTLPSVISLSVSLIFAGTLSIRNPIPCVSFQYSFRSYHSLFSHLDEPILFR